MRALCRVLGQTALSAPATYLPAAAGRWGSMHNTAPDTIAQAIAIVEEGFWSGPERRRQGRQAAELRAQYGAMLAEMASVDAWLAAQR